MSKSVFRLTAPFPENQSPSASYSSPALVQSVPVLKGSLQQLSWGRMTKAEVVSQENLENICRVMKIVQTTHRRKGFKEDCIIYDSQRAKEEEDHSLTL
jgi:hypothetical protein